MRDPELSALIKADPNDGARWLAVAGWYTDNEREDEAVAVRVFWRALRDELATGWSIEAVLDDLRRSASILGACAREIEERACDR